MNANGTTDPGRKAMTESGPHKLTRRRVLAVTAALALAAPASAGAQTFPQNRPITVVVPFSAGGGTDIMAASSRPSWARRWAGRW